MECQIQNSKFTFGKEFIKSASAGLSHGIVSSFGLFIKKCGLTWRVSDCEELVGVTHWSPAVLRFFLYSNKAPGYVSSRNA